MTADEYAYTPTVPEKMAWMACHFSPYTTGLCNLPEKLPTSSLLILNDSTPPINKEPELVAQILKDTISNHDCCGLLLDFQRPDCEETAKIVEELVKLELPVCVSESYAKELDCPVFVPPLPMTVPLTEYIKRWKGREIWLDTALSCESITITEKGSESSPVVSADIPECPHKDEELHCHYRIEHIEDGFCFTLCRTKEDLDDLLLEAESLGITTAVGLYQELK